MSTSELRQNIRFVVGDAESELTIKDLYLYATFVYGKAKSSVIMGAAYILIDYLEATRPTKDFVNAKIYLKKHHITYKLPDS